MAMAAAIAATLPTAGEKEAAELELPELDELEVADEEVWEVELLAAEEEEDGAAELELEAAGVEAITWETARAAATTIAANLISDSGLFGDPGDWL